MENKCTLTHHGILGQRWGIRRYQNPDGTLTEAGKKRYSRYEVELDFQNTLNSNKEIYDRIISKGREIPGKADELMKDYQKALNKVSLNEKEKSSLYKAMQPYFGSWCDDNEQFDLVLEDYVRDEVLNKVESELKTKRSEFDKMQEEYWNDVHSITSSLIDKYSDAKISDVLYNNGDMLVNELIRKKLDTSFNAYIYRHFDDYWVYDTDEFYNAISRNSKNFSMEEYNRKWAT